LLDNYPDYFWCDPDVYPISREGQEQANANAQYAAILANTDEFSAIRDRLGLGQKPVYTDAEKLAIYREHKKLTYAVQFETSIGSYPFVLRVGQNQGQKIEGSITPAGVITEVSRVASINTCPICLSEGTLIDTPTGSVPVEQIRQGMTVWTVDGSGKRVTALVAETSRTPVPLSFQMVKITLQGGRTVTASPGHPSADLKAIGEYRVGDSLDGSQVIAVGTVDYNGGATYDLLPSGATGLYYANEILLGSTLK
jgi:hypothetical protein